MTDDIEREPSAQAEMPPTHLMMRFARFGNRAIWSLNPAGFYEDPGFEGAEFATEEKLLALPGKSRGCFATRPAACCWNDLVAGGSVFNEFVCGGFPSWEAAEEWLQCQS